MPPHPRSFRLVCPQERIPEVEELLRAQGYIFTEEPFSPWCRRLLEEPQPLGSSLAALFGYVYIQDRSSMLPPLALCPPTGSAVLDMCASPGSKTGFLAQLVGSQGFVLGNEPTRTRLGTLRANMHTLNLLQVATCSEAGEQLPLSPASWDYIQLDPPCSGWGTVAKNPQALKLWQGDKVKPLIHLQRALLRMAHTLLRTGGSVVYSTCTTNSEENEQQIRYATEELGFVCESLTPFSGFSWEEPASGGEGTLRVNGTDSQAQGFYIARLRKSENITQDSQHTQPPSALLSDSENAWRMPESGRILSEDILTSAGQNVQALPAGTLGLFGDQVRFVSRQARTCLPAELRWQGALLGKMRGERLIASPRLRALLPAQPASGALSLDNIDDISHLLRGCSRQTGLKGSEAPLYWRALPLAQISLKNGRAILSLR